LYLPWSLLSLTVNIKHTIHIFIILPVALYGWEIWSLTLRKEDGLMVLGCWGERLELSERKKQDGWSREEIHAQEIYIFKFSFTKFHYDNRWDTHKLPQFHRIHLTLFYRSNHMARQKKTRAGMAYLTSGVE
jgi:hypothetical protein